MNLICKYPVLAKPSGITLEQHAFDVILEGEALCGDFVTSKYAKRIGKSLRDRIRLVCRYHDFGKRDDRWQNACQKDHEEYRRDPQSFTGENLKRTGIRHEFYSAAEAKRLRMPLSLIAAIAAHHGRLNVASEKCWQDLNVSGTWKELRQQSWQQISFEEALTLQYEYSALRALLQLADHRASAREDGEYVPDIKPFSYHFPHAMMRPVQKLIAENWKRDLLLLRAPTGAGKTDASLLWAKLQIENLRADRLVIAMPTRFTSNALAISVAESLSETGLYHSSAWYSKYQQKVNDAPNDIAYAKKEHELARLLETPVTVCTIDHLLMALTLTREDHHLITFNLANSCLVIDEADFYDEFTQANILVLLKALRQWDVPVLLMSASLPEAVLKDYHSIGYDVDEILTDHSNEERIRFEIKDIRNYESVNDLDDLLELMISRGNGIIYANTIDKALQYAHRLQDKNYIDFVVYHSRFTEPDKKAKEEDLINNLGKAAWQNGTAHGIAILTQIGEMSINISANIMISDLCPIDRLMQRTGRLCRFSDADVGEFYVTRPFKNGVVYPAPYGTPPQKGQQIWEACAAYVLTNEKLEKRKYSTKSLLVLLNDIYNKGTSFSVKSKVNSKHLEEYFMYNWLIGSKERANEDETTCQFWKSRDIPPQESLFVVKPVSLYFKNWHEFNEYKLSSSIEVPLYLTRVAIQNNVVDNVGITIGLDQKLQILIIRDGFYNTTIGFTPTVNNDSNFL